MNRTSHNEGDWCPWCQPDYKPTPNEVDRICVRHREEYLQRVLTDEQLAQAHADAEAARKPVRVECNFCGSRKYIKQACEKE